GRRDQSHNPAMPFKFFFAAWDVDEMATIVGFLVRALQFVEIDVLTDERSEPDRHTTAAKTRLSRAKTYIECQGRRLSSANASAHRHSEATECHCDRRAELESIISTAGEKSANHTLFIIPNENQFGQRPGERMDQRNIVANLNLHKGENMNASRMVPNLTSFVHDDSVHRNYAIDVGKTIASQHADCTQNGFGSQKHSFDCYDVL
ncbi:unnamed protein product, partial [Mycena citricolor]